MFEEDIDYNSLKLPIRKVKFVKDVFIPDFAEVPYQLQTLLDEIQEDNINSIVEFIANNYKKDEIQIPIDEILFFSNLRQKKNNLFGELLIKIGEHYDFIVDPVKIGRENGFIVRYMYDKGYYSLKQVKDACENCSVYREKGIYLPLYLFFAHEFSLYEKDAHYYGFSSKYYEKLKEDDYYLLDEILKNGYETNSMQYCLIHDDLAKFKIFLENDYENGDTILLNTFEGLYRDYELYLVEAAAYFGAVKIFKYLFDQRVIIDGDTVRWAVIGGSKEIIDMCLERDADFSEALQYAFEAYNPEIADYILKITKKICTPQEAAKSGYIKGNIFVLGNNNSISGEALHVALSNKKRLLANILLQEECDATWKSNSGRTCLHEACQNGYYEIVTLLTLRLADFSLSDSKNTLPLHLAASSGDMKLFKFVLENSKDFIDEVDDFGTPLHYACRYGFYQAAECLLNAGAGVNKAGSGGYTPLHIASKRNNEQIVRLLKERGANMVAISDKGHKPKKISKSFYVKGIFH